jgi:hypothetical protein
MSKARNLWRPAPSLEDLEGAQNYLSLLSAGPTAKQLVHRLSRARTFRATAKDLLRASNLPLLPRDESHVQQDLKRIHKGKPLSPVLLVQGDMSRGIPLVIADGYHRICAVCYFDEDASIAYRMTAVPR